MSILTYHIASTLDGYIAKKDGTLPGFAVEGTHVDDYFATLETYDKIIMGRKSYEAGYAYGMEKGQNPYPHARSIVFSKSMRIEGENEIEIVGTDSVPAIKELKATTDGEIYLCGGGKLAGALLKHKMIDKLIIKLAPIVYGQGISIFGELENFAEFELVSSKPYDTGTVLLTYKRA